MSILLNPRDSSSQFLESEQDQDFLNFLLAASVGNIHFLKNFVERRQFDINKIDDTYHASATHFAAKHNQIDALQYLISVGATLGKLTNHNLNELHYAISLDGSSVAKFLLEETDIKVDYQAFEMARDEEGLEAVRDLIREKLVTIIPRKSDRANAHDELQLDEQVAEIVFAAEEFVSQPSSTIKTQRFFPIKEEGKVYEK